MRFTVGVCPFGLSVVVVTKIAVQVPFEPIAQAGMTFSSVLSVQAVLVTGRRYAPLYEAPPYARHPTAPVDAAGEVIVKLVLADGV